MTNQETKDNIAGILTRNSVSIKAPAFPDEPHIHEIDFEATVTDLLHFFNGCIELK